MESVTKRYTQIWSIKDTFKRQLFYMGRSRRGEGELGLCTFSSVAQEEGVLTLGK